MKIHLLLLLLLATMIQAHNQSYTLRLLKGKSLQEILPFIAEQRIKLFKEYPYLYEGNYDKEIEYLSWFISLPHTAVAVAYLDNNPVGFVSGTSFVDYDTHFEGSVDLFKKANLNPTSYYYFTEGIVLPEHRGASLCKQLLNIMENHAKNLGYTLGCFVDESHDSHPLKPDNYFSLASYFHKKLGYTKSSLSISYHWPTIQPDGSNSDQNHTMYYWFKEL